MPRRFAEHAAARFDPHLFVFVAHEGREQPARVRSAHLAQDTREVAARGVRADESESVLA